jgi:tetratricopeptide (TPR) repeat protein
VTTKDRTRVIAHRHVSAGNGYRSRTTPERIRAGLAEYDKALALYKQINDKAGQATSLQYIGRLYEAQSDYRRAFENYSAALALNYDYYKENQMNYGLKRTVAIGFITMAVAISAAAQIKIGDIKIGGKKPDPTKPSTTSPPNTNGNKTPTTNSIVNSTGGGSGASREEVNAFRNDLNQFVRERMKTVKGGGKGVHLLKNMADQAKGSDYSGCGASEANMRLALDDGAAFAEIVKAKYATIENPTWTNDPESMVGDWRRAVENRNDIMKTCITTKLGVDLQSQVRGLEEALAKFKANRRPESGLASCSCFTLTSRPCCMPDSSINTKSRLR